MAFFKFRFPGSRSDAEAGHVAPAESIEGLRRRARHRLIGAAVLVLVAVIGFPLVFDTQPRPVAVDVAIQIPDRNKVKPLAVPSAATDAAPSVAGPVVAAGEVFHDRTAPCDGISERQHLRTGRCGHAPCQRRMVPVGVGHDDMADARTGSNCREN